MRRKLLLILLLALILNDVTCWRRRRRRRRRYVPPAVHGGWSAWVLSGSCSKTCGRGMQQRSRTCTNPRPAHGGRQCTGGSTSRVPCNIHDCPIKVSNPIYTNGGIKYQLVSCFKTTQKKLTQLLITERDPANSAWNGRFVDWHNWSSYMDEFLDRCATKAKSKSLRVFGVSKYAECLGDKSVSNALSTFPTSLRDFSKCVTQDWSFCKEGALRCAGGGDGIAVYQIL